MKKERNAFFQSVGYNSMNPNMMHQGMPGAPAQISSNANFYAGPPLNAGPNIGPNMNQSNIPVDIDSRLAKIERQINRLETRVNKLEGDSGIANYPDNDYNYSNSMYMV
ncbi:MAG: hypothetical protein PHF21_01760 [Bacilli bacterium]|nr:hypothetical protein [Bacilli bacterium]